MGSICHQTHTSFGQSMGELVELALMNDVFLAIDVPERVQGLGGFIEQKINLLHAHCLIGTEEETPDSGFRMTVVSDLQEVFLYKLPAGVKTEIG